MLLGLLGDAARRLVRNLGVRLRRRWLPAYMTWQHGQLRLGVVALQRGLARAWCRVPLAYPQAAMALGACWSSPSRCSTSCVVVATRRPADVPPRPRMPSRSARRASGCRSADPHRTSHDVVELVAHPDAAAVRHPRLRRVDRVALAVCGFVAMLTKVSTPAGPGAGDLDLASLNQLGPDRAADVHLDGRDPLPHQAVGGHVRGPGAVAARLPGRLLHVNVLGCAIFAAVSGSSAATCATIGRISHARTAQARLRREAWRSARWPAPARSAC